MKRHRISTAQLLLGTERAQLAVEQRWRNTNLDHGDMRIRSTTSRPGTDMGDFSEALRVPAQRQAGRVPTVVQSCNYLLTSWKDGYTADIKGN